MNFISHFLKFSKTILAFKTCLPLITVASSLRDEPASTALRVRATRYVCTHLQLQLENGQKAVVCQLGEQHHPATSVDKKLVDGRRPVSDLPAPGDPHTSDSIVTSPPRDPPRP